MHLPLSRHNNRLLLEAEHPLARAMPGLLHAYAGSQHPHLEHVAYLVIQTVEALDYCYVAHSENTSIT